MTYRSIVDIKHESVGTFNEDLCVLVLGILHQGDRIDGVLGQGYSVLVKSLEFLFDIVLEKVAVTLRIARVQVSQFSLESLGVENLGQFDTSSLISRQKLLIKSKQRHHKYGMASSREPRMQTHCSLCRIRRSNAAAGGANLARTELNLFEAVNSDVEIQIDGDAVRDKDAVVHILETLLFQHRQLRKEGGDVENDTRADQVDLAMLSNQTAGEKVKAVVD